MLCRKLLGLMMDTHPRDNESDEMILYMMTYQPYISTYIYSHVYMCYIVVPSLIAMCRSLLCCM